MDMSGIGEVPFDTNMAAHCHYGNNIRSTRVKYPSLFQAIEQIIQYASWAGNMFYYGAGKHGLRAGMDKTYWPDGCRNAGNRRRWFVLPQLMWWCSRNSCYNTPTKRRPSAFLRHSTHGSRSTSTAEFPDSSAIHVLTIDSCYHKTGTQDQAVPVGGPADAMIYEKLPH